MLSFVLPVLLALLSSAHAYINGTAGNYTFDYVVIGGGTGGIPIATRLAQAGYSVAIVEAGDFYQVGDPLISTTPAGDFVFTGGDISDSNSNIDWDFIVQPQAGMNQRSFHYARGKCLGGTSARNAMIYQRGTAGSYQQWADLVGDQSYAFNNFDAYFKKSTYFVPPNSIKRAANSTPNYNPAAFSTPGGPLPVTYPNYAQPLSSFFLEAVNAVGIPTQEDFNSGSLIGAQYYQTTYLPAQQVRATSQNTYLSTIGSTNNLTVFRNTLGKKIIFDSSKKATGVDVQTSGLLGVPVISRLTVNKEVILSAGTFQSPQLLMVSGVGPAATLQQYGIPVVYNNPNVGQNMKDHAWFGPSYRVNVETLTRLANDPLYIAAQFLGPYSLDQSGPLTTNAGDFAAFEKIPANLRASFSAQAQSDLSKFASDWPEVEYIDAAAYFGNFSDPFANQPKDGYQYASIVAALIAPVSSGNISINSSDASDPPLINPNLLTSTTDQQVAIAAYKRIQQMFAASPIQPILIGNQYFPDPSTIKTDADILAYVRSNAFVYYHAGCTCAMGNPNVPGNKAVIDNKARVIGVQGVRVVDAAALPFLPPSHIQSTIYALAEKIADEIISGK